MAPSHRLRPWPEERGWGVGVGQGLDGWEDGQ